MRPRGEVVRNIAFLLLLGCLAPCAADACSFAPGYRIAHPPRLVEPVGASPAPLEPRVHLRLLQRGYGVGDGASCNDAGLLAIGLDGAPSQDIAGYVIRIAEGTLPGDPFPDALLLPLEIEPGAWGFTFVWLDLERGSRWLEPIDAVVEVRAVSRTGVEGRPAQLRLAHAGGRTSE